MSHESETQTEEMNSGEAEDHHIINIGKAMEEKIGEQSKLSRTFAHRSSCCVFRVPQSYIQVHGRNAYRPNIVSIGPYHHCKLDGSHSKMLEEHKWGYLGSLVSRTERATGVRLVDYVKAIKSRESEARDCYSETIDLNTDKFVEMMVLDGCFVIELFRKKAKVVSIEEDDPIFSMGWVGPCLARDLLMLENQIPLLVLQSLFDLSKIPGDTFPREERGTSFAMLALGFFNAAIPMPEKVFVRYINEVEREDECPKHLLDFLRSCFIPDHQKPPKCDSETRMIHCVTKLRRAGIKCKSDTGDSNSMIQYYVTKLRREMIRGIFNTRDSPPKNSFLDIKFKHWGVIEAPTIRIDDVSTTFLLNSVAYEQCHQTPLEHAYFTTYFTFMDSLINTPQDVGLLCDDQVIENYLGGDEEVANFFKCGKDVDVNIGDSYLAEVFYDINEYYSTFCNAFCVTFRRKYFDSPWSFISLVAAVLLLLLTISQTFFAAYDYYQPRKG